LAKVEACLDGDVWAFDPGDDFPEGKAKTFAAKVRNAAKRLGVKLRVGIHNGSVYVQKK